MALKTESFYLDTTPTEHPKTQACVEDRGASPPCGGELSLSSNFSDSDTEDSDEGEKSDLNTMDKTRVEGQRLYVSHKLPQESNT